MRYYIKLFLKTIEPRKRLDILTAQAPSAISKKRLNKVERSEFQLDANLKEVLTGNLLGDAYMRRFSINSRIIFRQGSINTDYLLLFI